jgi:hypothetical protein
VPTRHLVGPKGQLFAEPQPGPDEQGFRQDNTSSAYYNSPYFLAHKNQVQQIPRPRVVPPRLNLADFIPPEVAAAIKSAKKISFHAVGDTGAAKVNRSQAAPTAIKHEAHVADAMAAELGTTGDGPAFFFHLGDIIYNFGEAQYYYDQFYEPFRAYDRPIFAIPGNHDGMVFGQGSSAPQVPTLDAFLTNFCAAAPGPSPDAGGLVRSVMTQPGVYFTLDAPCVSIIGLYSNVLDGPGVISSQGGHFPLVNDQVDFLASELKRLKPDRMAGNRAVVLALHHPPLSADAKHGGSTGVQTDIDSACKTAGLWPDLVLSGHAHLYQRFTRFLPNGQQTPYIVSGSGGFAATTPRQNAPSPCTKVDDHRLELAPIVDFGYLTVTTDAKTLSVVFKTADETGVRERDSVTLDLKSGKLVSGGCDGNAPMAQRLAKPAKGGKTGR